MQDDERLIIIQNWIYKAEVAIDAAKKSIPAKITSVTENRIYYAIFYAAMALGYSKRFITSKHAQLLGWFNKNFIKTGILDKKLGQIYARAYDNRMRSDYTITENPDVEVLQNDLANAEMFVNIIKNKLMEDLE